MKPLAALLAFTLLSLSGARRAAPPLVPQLDPEDCSARDLQAGLALDEINKAREDGYILSLFRVADAHSQNTGSGHIYYLTIDVVETDCSVLSGKRWKDCAIRSFHRTVFGQCKAVIYINLPWRKVSLYSYNCTLSTVPPRLIINRCPDCPLYATDMAPYEERAEEMAEKYNEDSNNTQYYMVEKIEKASMQWVFSAAYFVEFTIRETNCSKLAEDVSNCEFLDDAKAHVGFCTGSLYSGQDGPQVAVSCEIYDPKADPECPHGKGHGRRHGHRKRGRGHGRRHGHEKGHGHHHHHHHHHHGNNQTSTEERSGGERHSERNEQRKGGKHGKKHGRGHGHGAPDDKPKHPPGPNHKRNDSSPDFHKICNSAGDPVGSVQLIHLKNDADVFPIPSIPDPPQPTASQSPSTHGLGPQLLLPRPLSFPLVPSNSTGCPAGPKHQVEYAASLLPVPK